MKFAPSGQLLATGSDDRVVLIWEREDNRAPELGSEDQEHWTVRKRLVAHDNDVQDIAWAPDGSVLVTVGLDRSIIVWNGTTFEKIKRFDVHNSHVKGVVFDPANKYFATASDDRSVVVFRYHRNTAGAEPTFSIETLVSAPFKESPLTTYFRRLSWLPDGQHLAAPNATNGPVTSVAMINRGDWKTNVSLIGHSSPCEVVRFSPRLYELDNGASSNDGKKPQLCSVVATSGQDKTLALWSTAQERPLLVANDIAWKTILDMVWSPDGRSLYLSSLDGTISALFFEKNELGTEIPLGKNVSYLYRYGGDRESAVFPESVTQLILEDKAESMSSTTAKIPEKEPDILEKRVQSKPRVNILNLVKKKALVNQVVKITKDGKKRVAPTLLTSVSSTQSMGPETSNFSTKQMDDAKRNILSSSIISIPKSGVRTLVSGLRERKLEDESNDIADKTIETKPKKISSRKAKEIDYPEFLEDLVRELVQSPALTNYQAFNNRNRSTLLVFGGMEKYGSTMTLHVQNNYEYERGDLGLVTTDESEQERMPTRIVSTGANGNRIFEIFVADSIVNCISNDHMKCWIMATNKGLIHIISYTGRHLCPQFTVGSNICVLRSYKNTLLVITADGLMYYWDISCFKLIFDRVCLGDVLRVAEGKGKKVGSCELNDRGVVVVETDDGMRYAWSNELYSWVDLQGVAIGELRDYYV